MRKPKIKIYSESIPCITGERAVTWRFVWPDGKLSGYFGDLGEVTQYVKAHYAAIVSNDHAYFDRLYS